MFTEFITFEEANNKNQKIMCTNNSDCSGGAVCINGKCSSGKPPVDPPVPPLTESNEPFEDEANDEVD